MHEALVYAQICFGRALQSEQSCRQQQRLHILSEALKVNIITSALIHTSATAVLTYAWECMEYCRRLEKEKTSEASWNAKMDSNKLADDGHFMKKKKYSYRLFSKVLVAHWDVLQSVQQPLWAGSFRQSFTGANTLFIRLLQMP